MYPWKSQATLGLCQEEKAVKPKRFCFHLLALVVLNLRQCQILQRMVKNFTCCMELAKFLFSSWKTGRKSFFPVVLNVKILTEGEHFFSCTDIKDLKLCQRNITQRILQSDVKNADKHSENSIFKHSKLRYFAESIFSLILNSKAFCLLFCHSYYKCSLDAKIFLMIQPMKDKKGNILLVMELFLLVQLMQDRFSHRIKHDKYSLQL